MPSSTVAWRRAASLLAKLALFSLPSWDIGRCSSATNRLPPPHPFVVTMTGVAVLAFFVFLKQHLLDRKLLQLLQHSRESFDNLQRLQGRVIQQAKLASLGELVALAASELTILCRPS